MISLFSIFFVFLYTTYSYLYFWQIDIVPIKPFYWHLLAVGSGSILIATHRVCWHPGPHITRLFIWAVMFVVATAVSYLYSSQGEAATQTVISYYESVAILVVMALLFRPEIVSRRAAQALVLVVLLSVVLNFVDFFSADTMAFSKTRGRAAGLYENANIAGKYLVLGMVLAQTVLPRSLRLWICLTVGLGVLITFSRSSILMWGIAVIALSWYQAFSGNRIRDTIVMSGLLLVLGISLAAGTWISAFEEAGVGDQLSENSRSRIGQSFFSQEDRSTTQRMAAAGAGLKLFLDAPVLGHGIGATREWETRVSTHNAYLLVGAEQGIVGILLVVTLIWILWRSGSPESRIIAVLYAISGLFTHNNLEQPAMQVLLALAVAGVGASTGNEQKSTPEIGHPAERARQLL